MTTIECQLTVESQNVTHVHSQLNFAENVTRDFFQDYISTQRFWALVMV